MKVRFDRVAVVAFLALFASSCATERMIGSMHPGPAPWLLTPPQPTESKTYFVGRSLGGNILDEKEAINEAMNDAAYQVARMIRADIGSNFEIYDSRRGERIRGRDVTDQGSHSAQGVDIRAIVLGLTQEGAYWEKWSVRNHHLTPSFQRYKYWVLASYSTAEIKRITDEIKSRLVAGQTVDAGPVRAGRPRALPLVGRWQKQKVETFALLREGDVVKDFPELATKLREEFESADLWAGPLAVTQDRAAFATALDSGNFQPVCALMAADRKLAVVAAYSVDTVLRGKLKRMQGAEYPVYDGSVKLWVIRRDTCRPLFECSIVEDTSLLDRRRMAKFAVDIMMENYILPKCPALTGDGV